MNVADSKKRLLEQAAARFGVSPLARELKVPDSLIAAWLSGHADIPDQIALLVTDLLEKRSG